MKTIIKTLGIITLLILTITSLNAQKLGNFGSLTSKKVGPKTIVIPYTDVVTYLGYATAGTEDEVKEGKKFYYIYVWIPAVAPEIGVRMMSPAGDVDAKEPIVSPDYTSNIDSEDYFDTYITLEKSDIKSKDNISEELVKTAKWTTLEQNDDSGDMPKDPGGNSYNSLLRYKSDSSDPLKALTVGLYRIGFTTYKTGEVNGTFIAQLAAPIKLPGVAVAKTIEDLLLQFDK